MFSTKCQPGVAPQREWHGRHLDYGEAQSFQDLLFCRSLRLIGNELHAGLAGSPWISVQDLQTHCATPSAPTPIEHASEVRSRVASETTYSGWADTTTWPGLPPLASYGVGRGHPGVKWLAPSFRAEPRNPQQGLSLTKERHAQIYARDKHVSRTEFCRDAVCQPVIGVVERAAIPVIKTSGL